MISIKRVSKRLFMTLLFLGAVTTTFEAISGVKAKDVANFYNLDLKPEELQNKEEVNDEDTFRFLGLTFKTLNNEPSTITAISSSVETINHDLSLEDAFDWSKYPTKKSCCDGLYSRC